MVVLQTIFHCFLMPIFCNISYFRLLMSAINISPDFSFFDIHFKPHSNFYGYFEYIKIH